MKSALLKQLCRRRARFVEHRFERPLLDQPAQHLCRPKGTVSINPLGTEPKTLFSGALDQCACRAHLGMPDSLPRLDIDDDQVVVVGVGNEGLHLVIACPLRDRIRPRAELRHRPVAAPQAASSRMSNSGRNGASCRWLPSRRGQPEQRRAVC